MTILIHGEPLRGPQSPDELDLREYFRLCHKHARRYAASFGGHDEAYAIALMGLVRARNAWDPQRGPFEAIAPRYVKTELLMELDKRQRQNGIALKDRTLGRRLARAGRRFREGDTTYQVLSADAPIADAGDGGLTLADTIADPAPSPEELLADDNEADNRQERLQEALATIKPRNRDVLLARMAGQSLQQLGLSYGVSRERIRQLEQDAITAVRKHLQRAAMPAGKAAPASRAGEALKRRQRLSLPPARAIVTAVPPPRRPPPQQKPPKRGMKPAAWRKDADGHWIVDAWR